MGGFRHGGYFFLNWLTVLLTTLVAQSFGERAVAARSMPALARLDALFEHIFIGPRIQQDLHSPCHCALYSMSGETRRKSTACIPPTAFSHPTSLVLRAFPGRNGHERKDGPDYCSRLECGMSKKQHACLPAPAVAAQCLMTPGCLSSMPCLPALISLAPCSHHAHLHACRWLLRERLGGLESIGWRWPLAAGAGTPAYRASLRPLACTMAALLFCEAHVHPLPPRPLDCRSPISRCGLAGSSGLASLPTPSACS